MADVFADFKQQSNHASLPYMAQTGTDGGIALRSA